MGTWARQSVVTNQWVQNYELIASIPRGESLLRTRFGWGASITMDSRESALNMQQTKVGFGLITCDSSTVPTTLPNPATSGTDPSPPLYRYIWWEQRIMQCRAWDADNNFSFWQTSEPQDQCDSHSQVLANVATGHTLFLYAVWGFTGTSVFTGEAAIWAWASALFG